MKRRNEVLVGGLLLTALLIGIVGTIWLVRGGLKRGYPLFSVFRWGANLKVGQPVALAGVQIGYVADVILQEDGRLIVRMAMDKGRRVPKNARAVVEAVGIFGDAQVALQATPSAISYQAGDTVPAGVPAAGIAELTAKADSVATVAVTLSRRIQSELVDSGAFRDIRQALRRTDALVAQFSVIAAEQNRQLLATERRVNGMLAAVDTKKIDSALTNVRTISASATVVSANAAALTDSLRHTTTRINGLLDGIQRGNGTAGKLLSDTLLYSDIRHLVGRLDSLTTDFQKNPRKYVNLRIF